MPHRAYYISPARRKASGAREAGVPLTGSEQTFKDRYTAYINSDEWRAVRKRYRDSKLDWKCAVCGVETNLHLHHRTYKRLGKERLGDLVPLCEFHHAETHRVERAGIQLWDAHRHVGLGLTVLPPDPRKGKRGKQKRHKQLVKASRHQHRAQAKKKRPGALWCAQCHTLYPEGHTSLRCGGCRGYIVYRPEPTAARRLARRR